MKLTKELEDAIKNESANYLKDIKETSQYGNLSKEERDALGAFFTPPELCIQMLEMFHFDTIEEFAQQDILDPTCGSGNLLMAALIVGSSVDPTYPERVFGNELSESTLNIAIKRFVNYCENHGLGQYGEGFWRQHLHQGDALGKDESVNSLEQNLKDWGLIDPLPNELDAKEWSSLEKEARNKYEQFYKNNADKRKGIVHYKKRNNLS